MGINFCEILKLSRASLQGYKQRDAFVITQHPLTNTVTDFWTMVYDHDCKTIIMMNPMDQLDSVGGTDIQWKWTSIWIP